MNAYTGTYGSSYTAAYPLATGYVAGTWSGSFAQPLFAGAPPPAKPLQIAVSNTPGDWMVALITWRQAQAGAGVSVSVSDDAHNYWDPVFPAVTDSGAAGVTRSAIWVAPAARVANPLTGVTNVQVCPTGLVMSVCAYILDLYGLLPWLQTEGVNPGFANAATSLSLGISSSPPPQAAVYLACAGSDLLTSTITGPGTGWAQLTPVTASNGSDHTADLQLNAAWQQATVSTLTATWNATAAVDFSGVTAGLLLAAAPPFQPNPMRPVIITELAIGGGAQTPPSQLTWTDLSGRDLALSMQQGRQYTLGQLQAGQGQLTADNPDGALIPPGSGPYAGIDSGTPVRQRMIWTGGAWQVKWNGNGTTSAPQIDTGAIFSARPGVTYQVPAWLACSLPYAAGVTLSLRFKSSGGTLLATFNSQPVTGPQPTLAIATGTAPAGTATAAVVIAVSGTPPVATTFTAAAGSVPASGGTVITIPPSVSWLAENGATSTTLAPWSPDPRGAPVISPHYVAYSGYFARWPYNVPGEMLRGQSQASLTDIWGYATAQLNSMARQEQQLDSPYAQWPLSDPAGSTVGSNIAAGNSNPLVVTVSKYGAGGATYQFGQQLSSGAAPFGETSLVGDSSATNVVTGKAAGSSGFFEQALPPGSTALNTPGYGYALVSRDTNFPPITSGVSVDCWSANITSQASGGTWSFTATTAGSLFNTGGQIGVNGNPVVMFNGGGPVPGGFSFLTVYYVVNASGGNFQLAATPGGSPITVTSNGSGWMLVTNVEPAVLMSMRNLNGLVAELRVSNTTGALLLAYKPARASGVTVVTIDSGHDYRGGLTYASLAINQTSYRVMTINTFAGFPLVTGTFSSPVAATFDTLCFGGVMDRTQQQGNFSGFIGLTAVYPVMLPSVRSWSHYLSSWTGLGVEAAPDRVERILEYAGLTGRRWIGQETTSLETDPIVPGQDIGGQSAASSLGNVAASTTPAILYIAPTGDLVYLAKAYSWNQPIRWVLGDNTGAGEIPFKLPQFTTDYDPARTVNLIQLTQLNTQAITTPSGVMAGTTMQAAEAASQQMYGQQTYQQTGYMNWDATSPLTIGASMVDLANWLASINRKPANRVQAITVDAASYPAAWSFVAGASVGDMVQVNVRLPTAAVNPVISLVARINGTQRSGQFMQDGTSATITCQLDFSPEYQALTCDDPVRGLLNGVNVVPW